MQRAAGFVFARGRVVKWRRFKAGPGFMIAIINYGIGNLDSVLRAFRKCGADVTVSSSPAVISGARGLVLPGVGSFAEAMGHLRERGLVEVLNDCVMTRKVPVLGICLGFQMFTRHSEEGDAAGLGWIDGVTRRFDFGGDAAGLRVPHMGWDEVFWRAPGLLLTGIPAEACFYFAHSYYVDCEDDCVLGRSDYGRPFVSAVLRDNLVGFQFHPEKSHAVGLRLLGNFVDMVNRA